MKKKRRKKVAPKKPSNDLASLKTVISDAMERGFLDESSTAYEITDALEDDTILAELRGVAKSGAKPLFYEYTDEETQEFVQELSLVGVHECMRVMAEQGVVLRVAQVMPTQALDNLYTKDVVARRVAVKGKKEIQLEEALGSAQQYKRVNIIKTGAFLDDRFAIPKVSSKAERNAFRKLIPERIRDQVLRMALEEGRVFNPLPKAKQSESQDQDGTGTSDPLTDTNAFLAEMDRLKKVIPIEKYLEVLMDYKRSNAEEVTTPRMRSAVLRDLRKLTQKPAMSMVR